MMSFNNVYSILMCALLASASVQAAQVASNEKKPFCKIDNKIVATAVTGVAVGVALALAGVKLFTKKKESTLEKVWPLGKSFALEVPAHPEMDVDKEFATVSDQLRKKIQIIKVKNPAVGECVENDSSLIIAKFLLKHMEGNHQRKWNNKQIEFAKDIVNNVTKDNQQEKYIVVQVAKKIMPYLNEMEKKENPNASTLPPVSLL